MKMPSKLRVVAEADAEAILVCAKAGDGRFADDVSATCMQCGAAIVHRPHLAAVRKKICIDCVGALTAQHDANEIDNVVTAQTMREIAMYFMKSKGAA